MASPSRSDPRSPLVVLGLMSGTSVDGIDAAVVEIADADVDGVAGLSARVLAYYETPFEPELRQRVHTLFDLAQSRVDEVCAVNVLLAEAFAATGAEALAHAGVAADLVASHGQTVWHQVAPGRTRATLQLGEPSALAERLQTTVVADFRPRDVAAGGQGAPLSSWPDALLFSHPTRGRAVQNIGGIGNVTWVPAGGAWEAMLAFDTGPGNALIDAAVWHLSAGAQRYDRDGVLAAAGRVDDTLLAELLAEFPYFKQPPPKSTGRELFGAQIIPPFVARARARGLGDADIVRTLTAFTAHTIADQYRRWLPAWPDDVVVGGGGSHNPVLMATLRNLLAPAAVVPHEAFGLPSSGREAVYFALLGYEALHGRPNTIPTCTGAEHAVVMGKLVPGPNYRALLARVLASRTEPSRRLTVLT